MAFVNKKRTRYARFFGLSQDEYMRAAGRIAGYLNKHGTESATIADALKFLIDTIEEARAKVEKAEFSYHFRSPSYKKWELEIVKLYQKGLGEKRISDEIVLKKGPRIPKSTIRRFLKQNGIKRLQNG